MGGPSLNSRFSLGLRWLDAAQNDLPKVTARDWRGFLSAASSLVEPRRLWLARLWPLLALLNGPLALSGLMVWPQRSGVHLLLFLLVFGGLPLALMLWTACSALVFGRAPWWRRIFTPHADRVITLWCARQALLNQGLFCLAGVVWMWLALLTRQVIFYWSTSIEAISEQIAGLFDFLSFGVLTTPGLSAVRAAEAGAISGWAGASLADSFAWAGWLTQVVALWVLLPWLVLLFLCQWRLHRSLSHWPHYNPLLRLRFEQACTPAVHYRALQPEQPLIEPARHTFPLLESCPSAAGFAWRCDGELPPGTVALGEAGYAEDEIAVSVNARHLSHWYIAAHAVPTGDLADLLQLHKAAGGEPQLYVLLADEGLDGARLDTLRHSWGVFLERNALGISVAFVANKKVGDGG